MLVDHVDEVAVTIGGVTHTYAGDRVTVRRDDSSTRDNSTRYRFLTIVVPLADEFPENPEDHR